MTMPRNVERAAEPVRSAGRIHADMCGDGSIRSENTDLAIEHTCCSTRPPLVQAGVACTREEQLVEIGAPDLEPVPRSVRIRAEWLEAARASPLDPDAG